MEGSGSVKVIADPDAGGLDPDPEHCLKVGKNNCWIPEWPRLPEAHVSKEAGVPHPLLLLIILALLLHLVVHVDQLHQLIPLQVLTAASPISKIKRLALYQF